MQTLDRDEVVRVVHAPPDAVYRLVSDVTRTPEHSPEILHCSWEGGATGPVVGARFEAINKAGRGPAWKNHPVVTVAEPGRAFAVSRTEKAAGTIVWRYDLEPHPDGTLVRQSYEVIEPVSRMGWFTSARSTATRTGAPACLTTWSGAWPAWPRSSRPT